MRTINKIIRKSKFLLRIIIQKIRISFFRSISSCNNIKGKPKLFFPTLFEGDGTIVFLNNVNLGVKSSAYYFSNYNYLEARNYNSKIVIGNNVYINNNATIVSAGEGIEICDDVLIGTNFTVYDSDFHELSINKRMGGTPKTRKVLIGKNVFIGSNVLINKGVVIGDNSVIGSGSVVTKSIPSNVIAAGNPCKVIKNLNE